MRIRLGFVLIVATLGGPALAAPFTAAYEGNDFPENEGWRRRTTGGGAERSIEDGQLVLDGRADVEIADYYTRGDYSINLEQGESFFAEWRLTLQDQVGQAGDPTIVITTDAGGWLGINIAPGDILFTFTEEQISFDFNRTTTFRVESSNLENYDLFADGVLIHSSVFRQLILSGPRVLWGDGVVGASSLSRWDYFRFGVVPEPSCGLCWFAALIGLWRKRRIQ